MDKTKTFFEYFHEAKEVLGFILIVAGMGISFGITQNDIGNMKTEMYDLKGDSKTIIELQSDLKNLTKSVDEIKGTNHDTYLLLLDMQKQYR